jgi:hypothetical protein
LKFRSYEDIFCFISADLELEIRPRGEEFVRSVNSNIVFTCSLAINEAQTDNAQISWYNKHGMEIVDTAGQGRYVLVIVHVWCIAQL